MNRNALGAKSTAKIRKKSQIAAISAEKSNKATTAGGCEADFPDFARPSGSGVRLPPHHDNQPDGGWALPRRSASASPPDRTAARRFAAPSLWAHDGGNRCWVILVCRSKPRHYRQSADYYLFISCSTVKSPVLLWIFSRAFGSRRTFETDSRGEGMGRVGYRRALPPSIWVMLTTEYMLA